MKVLLTGSSGYLGQYIYASIKTTHQVYTLSSKLADITSDLRNSVPKLPECSLVIHAAGKAHSIPRTEAEILDFYAVNVKGTYNLLKALEECGLPRTFVFISSVAVYGLEAGIDITEDQPLLANDPYGKSKIEAEQLVINWCKKNNVICTILRLPLIAGMNAPGNLKTMVNGIKKGFYFNIDGGKAQKSIVLADDVAKIIPMAATIGGIYNLTDGYHPSFFELSKVISSQLNKSVPLNIPIWLAGLMAKIGDIIGSKAPVNSSKLKKIISNLTFDDSKAKQMLGWKPTAVLQEFKIE